MRLLTLLLAALPTLLYAQQSKIYGVVSIHNSETRTGKRIYVKNALVEDDSAKANPALTDVEGQFTLTFIGIREKSTVTFHIKKTPLQVVNSHALTAITGQVDTIRISMSHPDSLNDYKRDLYLKGKTSLEKTLTKQLESKNKELRESLLSNAGNAMKINLLKDQISDLEQRLVNLEDRWQEFSRKYAPLNLDDADLSLKNAFALFMKGKVDSALTILQNDPIADDIRKVHDEEKDIAEQKELLKIKEMKARSFKEITMNKIRLKADIHSFNNLYDSTEVALVELLSLDSTNFDNLFDYATFLTWNKKLIPAISYHRKNLSLQAQILPKGLAQDANIAKLCLNLGRLYLMIDKLEEAKFFCDSALNTYTNLVNENPYEFSLRIAMVQNNLGCTWLKKGDYDLAEHFFSKSIQQLSYYDNKPQQGLVIPNLKAGIYNNMALIYEEKGYPALAETSYIQAYKINEKLSSLDPKSQDADFLQTIINLSRFYIHHNRNKEVKNIINGGHALATRLKNIRLQAYAPLILRFDMIMGQFFLANNDFEKADSLLTSVENRLDNSVNVNSPSLNSDLSDIYKSIGYINRCKNLFEKSISYYTKALLLEKNSGKVGNPNIIKVARLHNFLADAYLNNGDKVKAKMHADSADNLIRVKPTNDLEAQFELSNAKYYKGLAFRVEGNVNESIKLQLQALSIREELTKKSPLRFKEYVALSHHDLAITYSEYTHQYKKSEKYFQQAITIRQNLAAREPAAFEPDLARSYAKFAILMEKTENYAAADENLSRAISIYKKWVKNSPASFETNLADYEMALGNLRLSQSNYSAALTVFESALEKWEIWKAVNPELFTIEWMKCLKLIDSSCLKIIFTIKNYPDKKEYNYKIYLGRKKLFLTDTTNKVFQFLYAQGCTELAWTLLYFNDLKQSQKYIDDAEKAYPEMFLIPGIRSVIFAMSEEKEKAVSELAGIKAILSTEEWQDAAKIFSGRLQSLMKYGFDSPSLQAIQSYLSQK